MIGHFDPRETFPVNGFRDLDAGSIGRTMILNGFHIMGEGAECMQRFIKVAI